MTDQEQLTTFPPPEGTALPPLAERLTQDQIDAYAEASGDHNPIHLDPDFARAVGLPSTIAHGLLTLGVAAAEVERWAGDLAYLNRVNCRFSAPVPSGDLLTGQSTITQVTEDTAEVELDARNQAGDRALSRAVAHLRRL